MKQLYGFMILLSLGFTAILISCTTTEEKSKEAEAENLTPEQKAAVEEARVEMEIGRNMAGRLLAFYGVYEDEKLLQYINQVAAYVAQSSDYPDRNYAVEILKNEEPNAFAAPGGYILLTIGAVKVARNEAELAAILGHEIAHVGKRHMLATIKKLDDEEKNKNETAEAALDPSVAVRKRVKPPKNEAAAAVARYIAGSAASLNILRAAKTGMNLILEKGLGADLEYEADTEGVRYAVNAGYQPTALVSYLCRIKMKRGASKKECFQDAETTDKKKTKRPSVLEKTHPPIQARIASLRNILIEVDAKNVVGALGRRRFVHYQNRLLSKSN